METTNVPAEVLLSAENVGGIAETEVRLEPGVTVLAGRNATTRTTLLQALMAALGSDRVSLKADADEGSATLQFGDRTYSRTLRREHGDVVLDGDPYLDDAEADDLFAFLLESNEARRTVARGDDLRDVIMRPVDTDAIRAEIDALEREKDRLDDELEEREALKRELPDLEQERSQLEAEIADTRDRLEAKEAELDDSEVDVEETRDEKAELEAALEELQETRSRLEDVRYDIETGEESVASLREERSSLASERDELSDAELPDAGDVEPEIERLRDRKRALNSEIGDLQSTIQFNEDALEERSGLLAASGESDGGPVTDQLLETDDTVSCWTCGTEVPADQIRSTLAEMRALRQEKLDESNEIQERLDDLVEEQNRIEAARERRAEIERRLDEIEAEIEERGERLEDLRQERETLTEAVADLEAEIDEFDTGEFGDVLDLHREANKLEFELERLESDLDDVRDEIEAVEERIAESEELRAERESVQDELEERRTRIERIERSAVEAFNEHMDALLDVLEYENLDRIWIERRETTVREGRRKVATTTFDLHVVRSTASGTTYEDTVDHLSESEREIIGLVFALAGYLVHDLHETVPFMLLDSLEAIDAERIALLVDYLEEHAAFLVVALLEEDAEGLDNDYHRITAI